MSRTSLHAVTETTRLILRAPTDADLDAVLAVYGDAATQRFNPFGAMQSRDAAGHLLWRWQLHWMRHGFGVWVICRREQPEQVLGFGGLAWRDDGQQLHCHIHLRADAAGEGIATEVGDAALVLAARLAPQHPVHARVAPEHAAARRVMDKLGFHAAGEHRALPWLPAYIVYRAEAPDLRLQTGATCKAVSQAASLPTTARPQRMAPSCLAA